MPPCTAITRRGNPCTRPVAKQCRTAKAPTRSPNEAESWTLQDGVLCWQHRHIQLECSICLETVGKYKRFDLGCKHSFHRRCIARWLRKDGECCPLCRHTVTDSEFSALKVKRIPKVDLVAVLDIINLLIDEYVDIASTSFEN